MAIHMTPPMESTARTTMRAAVLAAPRRIEIRSVQRPEPLGREVRVRLEGCGVCASNIPPWEGRDWFEYPMPPGRPGHEGWGYVDAIGDAVTSLHVGDRVSILSQQAYAEYDIALENMCLKLPTQLHDRMIPGEPLGCAINIMQRSDIKAGQTVAVIGIGFLGSLLVQLCKRTGARVIAISRRKYSLRVAREMGADEIIEMENYNTALQHVAELTGGRSGYEVQGFCDRVIECTGKEQPLQLAGECCAVRGRLIIAGYHQDGMRHVNMQTWNWRGLDIINAHERDPAEYVEGMRTAIELLADGAIDAQPLLTHPFPLDQINDVMRMTAERPDGFVKAVVLMN